MYALLLVVLRFLVGVVIGVADIFPLGDEFDPHAVRQYWLGYSLETTFDCLVVVSLFVKLARSKAQLRWIDVLFIFILQELIGFALNFAVAGSGSPSPHLFLDYFFLLTAILAGVVIGRWMRIKRGLRGD
ncbi:MAG: hypothetical protein ACREO8_05835 [Luteimonas sp.]